MLRISVNPIAIRIEKRDLVIPLAMLTAVGISLSKANQNQWHVILPTLFLVYIGLKFWFILWNRDGVMPVFEIGIVCMAAMVAYTLIPALIFLFSGGEYNPLSSLQLQMLKPTSQEFGSFLWYYVVYTASFSVVYLFFRGRAAILRPESFKIDALTAKIIFGMFIFLSVFFELLRVFYGVDFNRSYEPSSLWAGRDAYLALPHFWRQIVHNLYKIHFATKLGLIAILVAGWHKKRWRVVLIVWLLAELGSYLFTLGARTEIILIFMGFILLYHRVVKPISTTVLCVIAVSFFSAFFMFGLLRGGESSLQGRIGGLESTEVTPILTSNEFDALFAGAYDLYHMKQSGIIKQVPWQINAFELLLLIPQQLLPFEKVNPQEWYLALSSNPSYFMFNPISQALVGLGWIELVLRGSFLGWLFARLHRWYVRGWRKFWRTLFYLFLTVWSFYAIRSSTFMFVYFIIYHFLPMMMVTILIRELLKIKPRRTGPD